MKLSPTTTLVLGTALALGLAGNAAHAAGGDLFIYNWTDYTSPDVIAKFEKETGIKVTLDTYDSNETLLAKLKAGSAGYDIVVVSSDFVPIFAKEGLIQKVDASKMPGYDNIEARWKSPAWDKDNVYTIPYDWGVTSFSVNTKNVKGPYDSLSMLFDPPGRGTGQGRHVRVAQRGHFPGRGLSRHDPLPDRHRKHEEGVRPAGEAGAERETLQLGRDHRSSGLGRDVDPRGLERRFGAGPRQQSRHQVRLSEGGCGWLDGQHRHPDERQGSAECQAVHGIHAEAREQRPVLQPHPLRQAPSRAPNRTTIRP